MLKPSAKLVRMKALPWTVVLQAGVILGRHWRSLSKKDRARLARLVRGRVQTPRGNRTKLSVKERAELRSLLGKLDVKGMGRELLPLTKGKRRGKRRRR
ncbi:MAG TPA: hypothetical protein VGG98_00590 [Solirubrobacteraceae bacterium]